MVTASGSAVRLWYQTGWVGAPPMDATRAYSPPCSTRMSGVFRSLPLLLPRVVTMITGSPVSRRVLARWPPDLSYSSTWSRTHLAGLGSYSPSSVMGPTLGGGPTALDNAPGSGSNGPMGLGKRLKGLAGKVIPRPGGDPGGVPARGVLLEVVSLPRAAEGDHALWSKVTLRLGP